MKTFRNNGFRAEGAASYIKALQEEKRQAIQPLKEALLVETDLANKRSLKNQIKAIKTEFKKKKKSATSSLFIGP